MEFDTDNNDTNFIKNVFHPAEATLKKIIRMPGFQIEQQL